MCVCVVWSMEICEKYAIIHIKSKQIVSEIENTNNSLQMLFRNMELTGKICEV